MSQISISCFELSRNIHSLLSHFPFRNKSSHPQDCFCNNAANCKIQMIILFESNMQNGAHMQNSSSLTIEIYNKTYFQPANRIINLNLIDSHM